MEPVNERSDGFWRTHHPELGGRSDSMIDFGRCRVAYHRHTRKNCGVSEDF